MASYRVPKTPAASQSGVPVVADTRALTRLARDLQRAAPDARKAARARIRAAVEVVAQDARTRAGFSTRIPATVKVRGTGFRFKVVAGGEGAPDAAPLENKGREGAFRHPVFGNRERWVNQKARPFLAPALDAHREMLAGEIEEAVADAVVRAIGGR